MTPVILGQILGVAFACGLNLYGTVAALGLLSRLDIIQVPAGLQGLEGVIVIASALALYFIEAVLDRIPHADTLWDSVHTFVRPPAAALLTAGLIWGFPTPVLVAGALLAFLAALAVHATKAGLRITLQTRGRDGRRWISTAEDVAAVAIAVAAFRLPLAALAITAVLLAALLLVGRRLWRAFGLGLRALVAWLRSIFIPSRWREADELPRDLRGLLDTPPLGAAAPRGARAAVDGVAGTGAYRNGWLVLTDAGPVFLYRTLLGSRRVDLPHPASIDVVRGGWAHAMHLAADPGSYTVYLLRDGPDVEVAIRNLSHHIR
ncbi:MAG: DUF4126 family protein [Gemmatimonadetes bacterium]|nr:DUF4126 domain-containing protein [Gemmatimonadota bacterium]NIQ53328.1 DUF4126 domain-containing protein [Gemmatimonadota bacterium]NIU73467.1 DUF4126 family protein [Gammaproteobacteria bacterium]NIX45742.1 DUF4126 family protein [Gemmatimonadota bacterium]NIY12607.1 DUF4126 family protein [Gemmatimonadota bacterium]